MFQKILLLHLVIFSLGLVFDIRQANAQPRSQQDEPRLRLPYANLEQAERARDLRRLNYELRILRAKDYVEGRIVARYPFHELLNLYSQMEHYDPIAQKTVDRLYELAFQVNNYEDSESAVSATEEFRDLLHRHLPNLEVLNIAIPLVQQNSFLGDLPLMEWMRNGLEARVFSSGPGTMAQNAYRIFTLAEELAVLRHRNVRVVETDSISTAVAHYHIYMVQDLNTGAPDMIYMQLTPIMRHLREQQRQERPQFRFELRPQPALTD
ncbi:MAG: hypothetical protein ACK4VI_00215 [Alphaproteobacteria bacterium]